MDVGSSRVAGRDWLRDGLDDPQSERIQSVPLPGGRRARMQPSTYPGFFRPTPFTSFQLAIEWACPNLKIVDYSRRSCRWTLAGLPVAVPLAQR